MSLTCAMRRTLRCAVLLLTTSGPCGCGLPSLRIVDDRDAVALADREIDSPDDSEALDGDRTDTSMVTDARAPGPVRYERIATPSCPDAEAPGCARVFVEEGSFRMGSTRGRDAQPVQGPVFVDGFVVDAFEVTVARFRRFIDALGRDDPSTRTLVAQYPDAAHSAVHIAPATVQIPGSADGTYCTFSTSPGTSFQEQHPVNCVDWTSAQAFCAWTGGRLLTEAEYEYIARFWRAPRPEGRTYPWGDDESLSCAYVHTALMSPSFCIGHDGRRTRRVGSTPMGAVYGVHDLAGNVAEWLGDSFERYATPGSTGRCWGFVSARNPYCALEHSVIRSFRGGSWQTTNADRDNLLPESRGSATAGLRYPMRGLRCAYNRTVE